MKTPTLLAATALLFTFAAPVLAQSNDTEVKTSPGKASVTRTVSVVATVTEVDAGRRSVTLKRPDGRLFPLKVSADVRNLEQLSVGDRVAVQYQEALSLTLKKDGKELRSATATREGVRTPAGELPGGVVADQVEVTADVIAVDAKRQVVTLKGPKQTVEMRVPDPQQLKLIKVGDQVQAVYTQALAVSVTPAKK